MDLVRTFEPIVKWAVEAKEPARWTALAERQLRRALKGRPARAPFGAGGLAGPARGRRACAGQSRRAPSRAGPGSDPKGPASAAGCAAAAHRRRRRSSEGPVMPRYRGCRSGDVTATPRGDDRDLKRPPRTNQGVVLRPLRTPAPATMSGRCASSSRCRPFGSEPGPARLGARRRLAGTCPPAAGQVQQVLRHRKEHGAGPAFSAVAIAFSASAATSPGSLASTCPLTDRLEGGGPGPSPGRPPAPGPLAHLPDDRG